MVYLVCPAKEAMPHFHAGVNMWATYDPTRKPWYHEVRTSALAGSDVKVVLVPPYVDGWSNEFIVTMGYPVRLGDVGGIFVGDIGSRLP